MTMTRILLVSALALGCAPLQAQTNEEMPTAAPTAGKAYGNDSRSNGYSSEEAAGRADCALAKREQRGQSSTTTPADPSAPPPVTTPSTTPYPPPEPGQDMGMPCTDEEYALYKTALDPGRLLADYPTAAGYRRASPSRVQVLTELERARSAGELDWASYELGLPMQSKRDAMRR